MSSLKPTSNPSLAMSALGQKPTSAPSARDLAHRPYKLYVVLGYAHSIRQHSVGRPDGDNSFPTPIVLYARDRQLNKC